MFFSRDVSEPKLNLFGSELGQDFNDLVFILWCFQPDFRIRFWSWSVILSLWTSRTSCQTVGRIRTQVNLTFKFLVVLLQGQRSFKSPPIKPGMDSVPTQSDLKQSDSPRRSAHFPYRFLWVWLGAAQRDGSPRWSKIK